MVSLQLKARFRDLKPGLYHAKQNDRYSVIEIYAPGNAKDMLATIGYLSLKYMMKAGVAEILRYPSAPIRTRLNLKLVVHGPGSTGCATCESTGHKFGCVVMVSELTNRVLDHRASFPVS